MRSLLTTASTLLLLFISFVIGASSRPQVEDDAQTLTEEREPSYRQGEHPQPASIHDPLRWIWIHESSLELTWPSKFSLSLNDAVRGYGLSLTHPQHDLPFLSTTIYNPNNLHHKFEGLQSNLTFGGKLEALVGHHHWPYNLLNFTFTSAVLLPGAGLGQRSTNARPTSSTADLGKVAVGVTLRWSHSPFTTGALTSSEWDADGSLPEGLRPEGYLLQIWDHKQLILKLTTSVTGKHEGCMASIGGLELDAIYKATLQGIHPDGRVGSELSFSIDAGGFFVAGGALTTDGVSECYSGLQVRCPGDERCVSPYWICDGAPDCPDGADEIGCDKSPCDGYRCWDNICIPGSWRCDGHRDCKDGDDEYACAGCNDGEMSCSTVGFCFLPNATCDGVPDCPDGWDESLAVCGGKECSAGELPCWDNDHCVQHHRLCDGTPDCPAAEDEDKSFCVAFKSMRETTTLAVDLQASLCNHGSTLTKETTNCTQDEFRCKSGECIPILYLCNGHVDCETKDDEEPLRCSADTNVINVEHHQQSDDDDVSDEEAPEEASCGIDMIKCQSGKCVSKQEQCLETIQCEGSNHVGNIYCKNRSEADLNRVNDSNSIFRDSDSNLVDRKNGSLALNSSKTLLEKENYDKLKVSNVTSELNASDTEINITVTVKPNIHNNSLLSPNTLANDLISQEEDLEVIPAIDSSEENAFDHDITLSRVDVNVEEPIEDSAETNAGSAEPALDDKNAISTESDVYDSDNAFLPLPNKHAVSNTSYSSLLNISEAENEIDNLDTDSKQLFDLDSEELDSEMPASGQVNASTNITGALHENFTSKTKNKELSGREQQVLKDTSREEIEVDDKNETRTVTETTLFTTYADMGTTESSYVGSSTEAQDFTGDLEMTAETIPEFTTRDNKGLPAVNTTDRGIVNAATDPTMKTIKSDATSTSDKATLSLDFSEESTYGQSPTEEAKEHFEIDEMTEYEETEETMNKEVINEMEATEETMQSENNDDVVEAETTEGAGGLITSTTDYPQPISEVSETPNPPRTTYSTEPSNWKELPLGEKNVTVLIAIHSSGNESKIPQYVIHGMDGSTYQYEVVSIVNDKDAALNRTDAMTDEKKQTIKQDMHGNIHELSYLQGSISSGGRPSICSMLIISTFLNILLTLLQG